MHALFGRRGSDSGLAGILDLFEEHVYAGEVTPDGDYVHHSAGRRSSASSAGRARRRARRGALGVARPRRRLGRLRRASTAGCSAARTPRSPTGCSGSTASPGSCGTAPARAAGPTAACSSRASSPTSPAREEADGAPGRGERALHPSARRRRRARVPGAGASRTDASRSCSRGPAPTGCWAAPSPTRRWRTGRRPCTRRTGSRTTPSTTRSPTGEASDVEYRLIGADGITRWVHDRAATRRLPDGTVEISGIVSDVTERRRMRAELDQAHAALSRVVEAMDGHLYTLRVDADGAHRTVYRGPNREALFGGPLPGGDDDRAWESLVHPDDRERWRSAVAPPARGEADRARVPGRRPRRPRAHDRSTRVRPRRDADGTLFYDGVTRDVTERQRLENELHRAHGEAELRARTDELTGAFNRRHFAETVAEALADGSGRLRAAAARRRPLQAGQRRVRPCRRRRGAGRARAPAHRRPAAGRLPGALGRRGVRRAAAAASAPTRSSTACAERLRSARRGDAGRRRGREPAADDLDRRSTRGRGELDNLDALVEAADRCLYVAKRHGRDRVSLVPDLVAERPAGRRAGGGAAWRARWRSPPALREGVTEAHAEQVASLATQTAERMGLPVERDRALHARGLAPRRRQGRDPGVDPREARPARRRGVGRDADASGRRRGHRAPARRAARGGRSGAPPPRASRRRRLPGSAWRRARSRSRRASSPPPTPTPR